MTIEFQKHYTRADLQANPNVLYVFGDNLARVGLGGQAAEARGEPNAVGLPTKVSPSEFLTDKHGEVLLTIINKDIRKLLKHVQNGGKIVWPFDGIGTGLADLKNRAPMIYKMYSNLLEELLVFDLRCTLTHLEDRGILKA